MRDDQFCIVWIPGGKTEYVTVMRNAREGNLRPGAATVAVDDFAAVLRFSRAPRATATVDTQIAHFVNPAAENR